MTRSAGRHWMIGNVKRLLATYGVRGIATRLAEEYVWWLIRGLPGFEGVALRYLFLRCTAERLDGFCWISAGCTIVNSHRLSIGRNFVANRNVLLDAYGGIRIGDDCGVGPNTVVISQEHTTIGSGTYFDGSSNRARPIEIADRVWIGANCFVKAGVKIGAGAIVGAGSTVLGSVSPDARVIGVPAQDLFRALRGAAAQRAKGPRRVEKP